MNQAFSKFQQAIKAFPEAKIIAVSKLQSEENIKKLADLGQKDFAENYVQEFSKKEDSLRSLKLNWHFIGHIQTNKLKLIVGKTKLIHSVDSLKLLEKINQQSEQMKIVTEFLLQINLSKEDTKNGIYLEELDPVINQLATFKSIQIKGLMTMPPLQNEPKENLPYFKKLRELRDSLITEFPSCRELSMGTSTDYDIALEQSATMIRIGTALFGERQPK